MNNKFRIKIKVPPSKMVSTSNHLKSSTSDTTMVELTKAQIKFRKEMLFLKKRHHNEVCFLRKSRPSSMNRTIRVEHERPFPPKVCGISILTGREMRKRG
jgi:hypothetical protein